jgi:hypothetical protein
MIRTAQAAPASVQTFRKAVRQQFRRGINTTADLILDDLLVWLVDDLLSGEIETNEEAAEAVASWMTENFPEKSRKRS